MEEVERWRRAVIQIEGVADTPTAAERESKYQRWRADIDYRRTLRAAGEEQGEHDVQRAEAQHLMTSGGPVFRHYQGNAVVLRDGDLHFLLTAWSCLHGEFLARDHVEEHPYGAVPEGREGDYWREQEAICRERTIAQWVFSQLMRVPSSWPPDAFGTDPRISTKWIRLGPSPVGDEIASRRAQTSPWCPLPMLGLRVHRGSSRSRS